MCFHNGTGTKSVSQFDNITIPNNHLLTQILIESFLFKLSISKKKEWTGGDLNPRPPALWINAFNKH